MFNSVSRIINDVNLGNSITDFSTSTNYNNSRKRKNSKQKLSTGELILYMKTKETNGNSLFTHVQTLLDMFIFQNPIQPIKYFEYYSEKLRKEYDKPHPETDLDFLNNIEENTCKKIIDIYKDKIKSEETPVFDLVSNLSYEEDMAYEGENEYEVNSKSTVDLNETVVQDLSKINDIFNKAGCGLTNDEVILIRITMNQMSCSGTLKNIRYWGKILGLKQNYYILECEWKNEELQNRLMILNKMNSKNIYDYEDIYENEEEGEALERDSFSLGSYEQIEEEGLSTPSLVLKNNIYEQSIHKSESLCSFQQTEPSRESGEIFGFGANKMSYFVTNHLSEEWIELPLLKPHHIIQSRNMKRYFVGDLESRVESYPQFHGLEKHYLRAHIARITAGTQVSPLDYFKIANNHKKSNMWNKLNPSQSKILSQKWVHDYVINKNYDAPPVYDLLLLNNWVHITPLISSNGVTNAWTKLNETEDSSNRKTDSNDQITIQNTEEDSTASDQYDEYSEIFLPLSDDDYSGKVPPWKFELTNPFDHKTTYVTIKSNLWPGAFAVTGNKLLDYTYYGWGHKCDVNSYRPQEVYKYQSEYPNETAEITEMADPTYKDELEFQERVKKIKEDRKNKFVIKFQQANFEEDEEIILNQYNYDL